MAGHILHGIDPQTTEAFLLAQPDVLEAKVWMSEGKLLADVTVPDESGCTSGKLRLACAEELGLHQTPVQIRFKVARQYAA